MEVSSHGLDLGRADGISFAAVAFTNLTQDHLDYHGSMEDYFSAKSRLFLEPQFAQDRPTAVINADDRFGRRLAERLPADRLVLISAEGGDGPDGERAPGWSPALGALDVQLDETGARMKVVSAGGRETLVRSPLLGSFNVANVLTAFGLGMSLGLDLEVMAQALERFPGVPGRMERVDAGQAFTVLVDYAHTPDSVENALRTARAVVRGRLIALLGCGGDRDRGKRPLMGRAAERWADLVVITSDNPRSEDPEAIIADILPGLEDPRRAIVEPDRRRAIDLAFSAAGPRDLVMLLGKGHESGQQFRDRTSPFDDRVVAYELLSGRVSS